MKPFKLKPTIKDYIWGGKKLRTDFGKISDFDRLAESWELSCHKDGKSIILDGEFNGITLNEYLEKNKDALGSNCDKFDDFPILIKLIDACDNLSVQVHPDNEYALRVEGEYGKTEMWYIVDCEPNSSLIYGFEKEITKEEFIDSIKNNTLLTKVKTVPVKKGDVFFISAGTLHAIGKGIVIAEIQQNSNTTYRVYDYERVGVDGKPRELHIEKASEVTKLNVADGNFSEEAITTADKSRKLLSRCEYFTSYHENIYKQSEFKADEKSFNHILVLEGNANLVYKENVMEINKGDSIFIPAKMGEYKILGECNIIITEIE